MKNRLRVSVLIFVCVIGLIAVRKKFVSGGETDQFSATIDRPNIPEAVAQQLLPEERVDVLLDDEQDILPTMEKDARAGYLLGGNDPDILYKKYLLATYLYVKHGTLDALPLAISYAIQLGRYNEVTILMRQLPDIGTLKSSVETPVLMKLLFNTSSLSFASLKQLRDLIEVLYTQNSIDEADYNWYLFVMTVTKGDMNNAKYFLEQIRDSRYQPLYDELRALESTTQQFGSTPEYYLQGVWGMFLYQQGRWGPGRHIGQQIRQEDPNYLLAEQLVAYSSIALQDRRSAIFSLQQLQRIDAAYVDVYQFFQAIAHYFAGQYEASISLFEQIPVTSVYHEDVIRYLFLSYVALNSYEHIERLLDDLVDTERLIPADVYTVFEALVFHDNEDISADLVGRFGEQLERLQQRCQRELTDYAYICLYGKAGMLLGAGQTQQAYQILRRIVDRYPRSSLFTLLGDLAERQGMTDESQEWYRRAFLLDNDVDQEGYELLQELSLQ